MGEETFLSVDLLLPDGGVLLLAKVVAGNWWVRSFLFEKGKRGVKSFFKTDICSLSNITHKLLNVTYNFIYFMFLSTIQKHILPLYNP